MELTGPGYRARVRGFATTDDVGHQNVDVHIECADGRCFAGVLATPANLVWCTDKPDEKAETASGNARSFATLWLCGRSRRSASAPLWSCLFRPARSSTRSSSRSGQRRTEANEGGDGCLSARYALIGRRRCMSDGPRGAFA